jgi:hypothetical protein
MNERRRLVSRHVDAVLRALSQGEPVPQRPEMGSPQIDARVEALQTTLEQMYGPNRDICRSLAL